MPLNPFAWPPFAPFLPPSSQVTVPPAPPANGSFDFVGIVQTQLNQTAPLFPVNTVAPVVTGSTVEPATLTTTNGTWTNSPSSFSYQWYSGTNPVGTNATSYATVAGDIGNLVYCSVTATNSHGSRLANSNSVGPITGGSGFVPGTLFTVFQIG